MSRLLTTREAADLLGVSLITIYRWAENGVIPGIKFGRLWRFNRDTLLATSQPTVSSAPVSGLRRTRRKTRQIGDKK